MGMHLDARRTTLAAYGRPVTLRRLTAGSPTDVTVQAHDRSPQPSDVAAGAQQQDRVFETLNDEIASAGWPAPPRQNDKIVDGTTMLTVQAAWPVHEGADLIGWRFWVRG